MNYEKGYLENEVRHEDNFLENLLFYGSSVIKFL